MNKNTHSDAEFANLMDGYAYRGKLLRAALEVVHAAECSMMKDGPHVPLCREIHEELAKS